MIIEQLTIEAELELAPAGLVKIVVHAPAVEVRILDPRHLDTGGRRRTARDRQGRELRTVHPERFRLELVPAWCPPQILRAVVERMTAEFRLETPAPVSSWAWRATPREVGA